MANSNSNVVTIVGILAIVILVGLAIYFVMQGGGDDADFELDIDGQLNRDAPAQVADRNTAPPAPNVRFVS